MNLCYRHYAKHQTKLFHFLLQKQFPDTIFYSTQVFLYLLQKNHLGQFSKYRHLNVNLLYPTCGLCDSGITADEKFKRHKNGNVHRYVYYKCSNSKDRTCKNGYLEEKELIRQFGELMDRIDLNEIGIRDKLKVEVEKFKKFQKLLSGKSQKVEIEDIDIRNYAKFVLAEGSILEKRELLSNLRGKITLKDKQICLA